MTARAVPAGSALEQTYTKRGLLALSHAMERSLDVAPRGVDRRETLVIGLFQRRAYFQVEHDRYRELAESGATCIVGFDGRLDDLAPGLNAVGFGSPDPLEREWLLVVLDGHLGTSLVAHDLDDLSPNADSIEAGRLFRAGWSFDPSVAAGEADRILDIVGDQLPSDVLARARAATARSRLGDITDAELRLARVAEVLVRAVDAAYFRAERMEQSARRERAEHDSLTGLGNRRFLERFLSASTPGTAGTVAALMVDIDNLKTINDMYGHLAGDAAINSVARSLVESTRPQDVVVRFGGDEFVVLLPGLDEDAAMRVGERIVGEVSAQRLPDPIQGVALGVSVGVRVSPAWALDFAELDEALYSAKSAGKGRVQRLA